MFSSLLQPFQVVRTACVFALGAVVAAPLIIVWRVFEDGYYFALLFVKCGVNLGTATKWGAAVIRVNMVLT